MTGPRRVWTWPEKNVFIDGRLPQYEFAGHTMLEEYFEFGEEGRAEQKFNQYNIKLVLLDREDERKKTYNWFEKYILGVNEEEKNSKPNYLKEYLKESKEWWLAYQDDISLIYER